MTIYDPNTETSGSRYPLLPLKKRMRPLDDAADNSLVVPTKKVAFSGNAKFKGVVQHHNGNWGAQIYVDHQRIWLGTFKSAAQAAMAYDSASIKLRSLDGKSHRNFPCTAFTVHEPNFQNGYTTEAVLNMIKDGSYQQKFSDFVRLASQNVAESKQVRGGVDEEPNKCFSCTELFRKKLTASDVGKLNRLVIPKKHALNYLPFVNDDEKEREEGEIVTDVEVVFYDNAMRQWKFRYCYWKSSQSFVFTRGWNCFVKEKNLKENDFIVIYSRDVPTLDGQSKNFLMIEISHEKADETVYYNNSSEEVRKIEDFLNSNLGEEETKPEENKGGFMLFGVKIQ